MRGLDRAALMLAAVASAVPRLGVNRARAAAALDGGALATDEVMRRVERGRPFRLAYREVKEALGRGERFAAPSPSDLVSRRRSTGGVGNLGLADARARVRAAARWNARARRSFDRALGKLIGRPARPSGRPSARPR